MGMSKQLVYSTLFLLIAFISIDVADGYATLRTPIGAEAKLYAEKPDFKKSEPKEEKMEKQYDNAREAGAHVKYPLITAIHLRLAKVFGKYTDVWTNDWKLYFGLVFWLTVWAKWYKYGYDEIYYQRALFAFGINILILHHLQYTASIQTGMIGVCGVLTMQALFSSYLWSKSELTSEDHEQLKDEFICDTMYLDLSLPIEQILVLFVSQVFIWWFYMTSIIGNLDFNHVNYMFWLVAYLAMQMTMIFNRGADSVLGVAFPVHDVVELVAAAENMTLKLKDTEDVKDNTPFRLSKANIIMRGVMGFFCNAILREIMAYTIPLMLMGFEEPMDYVVYCVGVNFICTLDDMQEKAFVITNESTSARKESADAEPAAKASELA